MKGVSTEVLGCPPEPISGSPVKGGDASVPSVGKAGAHAHDRVPKVSSSTSLGAIVSGSTSLGAIGNRTETTGRVPLQRQKDRTAECRLYSRTQSKPTSGNHGEPQFLAPKATKVGNRNPKHMESPAMRLIPLPLRK